MEARRGESAAIVGVSGVGKSTLLHQLGGLDVPDEGNVLIAGRDITQMEDEERVIFRAAHLGFVFQHHGLLPEFTALENAAMPLLITGTSFREAKNRVRSTLESLGLGARLEHMPSELSSGEAQRAAIARALASEPDILLADEPTGNLDEETAQDVFTRLLDVVKERNLTLVVVTHNMTLARRCERILQLHHGELHSFQGTMNEAL